MEFFMGVRAGSHIHCNIHMHKTLQSQRKASLSQWKWRDDFGGERVLQWVWDPVLSVGMGGVILNPRTEFSFRCCPAVGLVLTKALTVMVTSGQWHRGWSWGFWQAPNQTMQDWCFVFCWCTRGSSWFSNVSLTGKMLGSITGKKSPAVASPSWFNNQEPKGQRSPLCHSLS